MATHDDTAHTADTEAMTQLSARILQTNPHTRRTAVLHLRRRLVGHFAARLAGAAGLKMERDALNRVSAEAPFDLADARRALTALARRLETQRSLVPQVLSTTRFALESMVATGPGDDTQDLVEMAARTLFIAEQFGERAEEYAYQFALLDRLASNAPSA